MTQTYELYFNNIRTNSLLCFENFKNHRKLFKLISKFKIKFGDYDNDPDSFSNLIKASPKFLFTENEVPFRG